MDDWDDESGLIWDALRKLQKEDAKWSSNFNVFDRFDRDARYRWWQNIKHLPSMQQLLLEVIKLRIQK